jgi:hypothetical protein
MTTIVTITTVDGDNRNISTINVGDVAQKHVLRSFNPAMKEDDRVGHLVDDTKTLCAAIIQRMIDLRDAPNSTGAQKRAASIAITQCEALQMQAVKANFVQA